MRKRSLPFMLLFSLLFIVISPAKVEATLGTLSVFNSDANKIGRWYNSSLRVYMYKLNENSDFYFTQAITNACSKWQSALGITITSNTNVPGSQIKFKGGTTTQLEGQGYTVPASAVGMTYYTSVSYEGTWYVSTNGATKSGYVFSSINGWIKDRLVVSNYTEQSKYKNVALHELGHSLGWYGHSSNSSDVMQASNSTVATLTNRDKTHLAQVY